MADDVQVLEQPSVQSTSTPAPAAVPSFTQEEMLPKSKVNDLVHERTKEVSQRSYEKGKSEALAELQRQQAPQQPVSMGGMPALDESRIRQMVSDALGEQHRVFAETQRKEAEQKHASNLANDLMGKIRAAKDRFPELEKRVDEIVAFPELLPLVNATEDAAGVMQDLIDNPLKMGQLLTVSQRSHQLAFVQMQKLASSIKENEAAKKAPHINPPLSHVPYSNVGMDSGNNTISDLRSQDWLRG